jgi:LPS-assembly protein
MIHSIKSKQMLTLLMGSIIATSQSASATEIQSCPGEPVAPVISASKVDRENSDIQIEAGKVDLSKEGVSVLRSGVILQRADQHLKANQVTLFREDDLVVAEGEVSFSDDKLSLSAADAIMELDADRTNLNQVEYKILSSHARGAASTAQLDGDNSQTRLTDVTFTTCPVGNTDWQFSAKEMDLDHETGVGRARGLGLRFKYVPLFYLPYASFPLDDGRKSGMLFPTIGSSSDNGIDLAVPFYWNIAPNQDATFTPRFISDRGIMAQGEYRYLSENSFGLLDVQYMPDDDLLDIHRSYSTFRSVSRLGSTWVADIDLRHVSDDQFFEDFGNSLATSSISFVRSRAELRAQGDWWQGQLMFDTYQTVDRDIQQRQEPYERLPRLYFTSSRAVGQSNFYLGMGAEAVDFSRDVGEQGSRIDLYPTLGYPVYRPAYYLLPSVGLRHTSYQLDRSIDDSPTRTTGIASVEGGLFFERETSRGSKWLQTLEPRFYYLYVPFESQANLPRFDTTDLTFSFNQLFRTNRFTGGDRQGDANQLSLALTTRVTDQNNGRQVVDASIGTIVYFSDQKVQLRNDIASEADTSPLVAEINYRPVDAWRLSIGIQYDPEDHETDVGQFSVQRADSAGRIFNLAYRLRLGSVEQVDASFLLPLRDNWKLIGRWNYSLLDDTSLEALAGFEYESCCWAVRAMGRRYLRNQEGDKRNAIYFELELKGLGSLGRNTEQVLERAILGYRGRNNY